MESDAFFDLFDRLVKPLHADEVLLGALSGERSDFVRFNGNRVRQASSVNQWRITLNLIKGSRQASLTTDITGRPDEDAEPLTARVRGLREHLKALPPDPYLNYATQINDSDDRRAGALPPRDEALATVLSAGEGLDLVGVWASGEMVRGFANSLGQRNWHRIETFNLDWSLHAGDNRAVKAQYAGSQWDPQALDTRMASAREELDVMRSAPRSLEPGEYRVYLAPEALRELLEVAAGDAFGLKAHETAQTPLLKMIREDRRMHSAIELTEEPAQGLAPRFTSTGFMKPDRITLVGQGRYGQCLVGARSAVEYDTTTNSEAERPQALVLAPGDVPSDQIRPCLGTGLYVSNLWYTNYSDRSNAKLTGLTRYGTYWVEGGVAQGPVNPMRFDDSLYRILGDCLEGLTQQRQYIMDSGTYEERSDRTYLLPGALISALTLSA